MLYDAESNNVRVRRLVDRVGHQLKIYALQDANMSRLRRVSKPLHPHRYLGT